MQFEKIKSAADLLMESNAYSLPVDLNKVTNFLKIKVVEEIIDDSFSGLLIIKNEKPVIGLNKNHPPNRKRFTIAHEIGHFILHHKKHNAGGEEVFIDKKNQMAYFRSKKSANNEDPREAQANKFAAELLMPDELIRKYIDDKKIDLFDDFSIQKLSSFLKVSAAALSLRLMKLGFTQAY